MSLSFNPMDIAVLGNKLDKNGSKELKISCATKKISNHLHLVFQLLKNKNIRVQK